MYGVQGIRSGLSRQYSTTAQKYNDISIVFVKDVLALYSFIEVAGEVLAILDTINEGIEYIKANSKMANDLDGCYTLICDVDSALKSIIISSVSLMKDDIPINDIQELYTKVFEDLAAIHRDFNKNNRFEEKMLDDLRIDYSKLHDEIRRCLEPYIQC